MEKRLKFSRISKFKYIFVILLLFAFILLSAYSYVTAVSSDLSKNLFRLHVIANSNSKEDQDLKYLVRDSVLDYVNSISKENGITSKQELISLVEQNKDNIKKVAEDTIQKNGFDYNVNISIGNFSFPDKVYGDITLPAGFYDALKIEIGAAAGQNWWCVMFPPLCFVDVSSGIVPEDSKETLQNNLSSDEDYNLLSTNSPTDLKLKFKIIELFHDMNFATAKQ